MRSFLGALAFSLVLFVAAPAQAGTVIDLGSFIPNGLNNRQQVVGDTMDPDEDDDVDVPGHAAVWKAGVLARLPEPSGTTASDAYAINASGRVAGTVRTAQGFHAVYWDGPTDLAHQIGPLNDGHDDFSQANGVDTAGEVVGLTQDANYGQFGFLRTTSGALNRVGDADRDGGSTKVVGITPDGTKMLGFVGTSAHNGANTGWYLWPSAGGSGTKLGIEPVLSGSFILGGASTPQYGNDLASDGTVLGYRDTDSGHEGNVRTFYLHTPDGAETPISGLVGHNAVNAKHAVVGTIASTDGGGNLTAHAAMRKPDGTVVDLNSLLPKDSGWLLWDALAINDNGDIVGLAAHNNVAVGFLLPAGFIVDSTGDQVDKTPGDGACLTAQSTCTLRAAIGEVSAGTSTTPTAVSFSLPGGATTIAPASALPVATKPIAIDGTTNSGGRVVLEGAGAGSASGLRIGGAGSTVRGMDIEHFNGPGIRVDASDVIAGGLPTDTPPCAYPCNVVKANTGAGIVVASGSGNALQGNRLAGNAVAIDLGGDGRTPNDSSDADSGANGRHNFPIGVLAAKDPVSKVVKVSGIAAADDAGETVDVYAQSAVTAARGAEPSDYIGSTQVSVTGGWALDVPATAGPFFSAAVTASEGTSELSPICGDPDGDGRADSDGDGLCDDWELAGIDGDGDGIADLQLPGASPTHKDLYLELDAMATRVGQNAPSPGAVEDVVSAFSYAPVENATGGTGIALHVNSTVDDSVPETTMNVAGTDVGTLDYIRNGTPGNPCDGAFGSHDDRAAPDCFKRLAARALAYRYVLFANQYSEDLGSSGFSAGLGGNTLTVTLGQWSDANVVWGGGGVARCHTLEACRRTIDAGTLMHEFGHSLGLHHGGRDDENFKPNYLSVMNYMFQMLGRVSDRPLDYSRFALPALDENALVESTGILGGTDVLTRNRASSLWPHTGFYLGTRAACVLHTTSSSGPIDWDQTAPIVVASTVVHDKTCAAGKLTLTSSEDWPDLRYSFRDQPGVLETPVFAGDSAPEETADELLAEAARNDVDGNGVNDLADSCRLVAGSSFADANGNGFADVCEAGMNRVQAFPQQANGSGGGGGGAAPGGGGGPVKDTTAPALSKLSAKPSIAQRARPHHKAKPATLRFTLSEAATVTFTGEQTLKGRLRGKRCVTGGKKGKACVNYKKIGGSLRVNAKTGTNTLSFAAKLGTKKLAAGSYRLTAVAIDAAGNRSRPVTVAVTVR
jgi:hypothetical protein